jgi:hypothetical protein
MIWTHVSELAIDRLLAGEVAPADAAAIHDHAGSCARCGALLDDALAVQRGFVADRPPLGLPIPLHRRVAVIAVPVAALAAAVALVVGWPRGNAAEVRTKGSAIVGCFISHGGQVRRGGAQELVSPGDRIELATTTSEPAWFAAISDDAHGARSVYVAPRPVEPGREHVVPLAIELDAAAGAEVVTGVFCPQIFDPLAIDPLAPPAGCTVDRFTLTKVPR